MTERSILIVENEEGLLYMFSEALGLNYHVLQAASVEKAIEILQQDRVDAVLTDLNLGQKSGRDLLKWVADELPELLPRCLVMSGNLLADTLDLGVPLIGKPVRLGKLHASIEDLFSDSGTA